MACDCRFAAGRAAAAAIDCSVLGLKKNNYFGEGIARLLPREELRQCDGAGNRVAVSKLKLRTICVATATCVSEASCGLLGKGRV